MDERATSDPPRAIPAASLGTNSTPINYANYLLFSEGECLGLEVGVALLAVLGCLGNLLVLSVYLARREKLVPDWVIMYVTGIDLVACVLLFPMEYLRIFSRRDPGGVACTVECVPCTAFAFYLETASGFALLVVAVDRYLSVCHPFLTGVTYLRLLVFIVASNAFSVALALMWVHLYGTEYWLMAHFIYGLSLAGALLLICAMYGMVFHRVRRRALRRRRAHLTARPSNGRPHLQHSCVGGTELTHGGPRLSLLAEGGGGGGPRPSAGDGVTLQVPPVAAAERRESAGAAVAVRPAAAADRMTSLSRRVLVTVTVLTALFAVSALPNSLLSMVAFVDVRLLYSGPLVATASKYVQMLYHANFVLAPLLYALMRVKFREDALHLCNRTLLRGGGGAPSTQLCGTARTRQSAL